MAHRVYPQNPAVPMQGSVGPAAGHRRPVQPPGYSHNPAGMNAATPPGVYANQGQPGVLQSSTVPAHLSGGRQTTGHRYPGPPATQIQAGVSSLTAGMQQMNIHPPPGGAPVCQPPPGPSSGQNSSGPPPSLKSREAYVPQWSSSTTKSVPPLLRPDSGQRVSGQGSVLPPPPPPSSIGAKGQAMAPPTSLGHPSEQSLGQFSHQTPGLISTQISGQTPGQVPRQTSGQISRQTSGQGLLPTPPVSGGLLPPPTAGHGQLTSFPASGQGILPTPQSGHGLLPPPTGPPSQPHTTPGHGSGQGLLPHPAGYLPPRPSSNYPPPPPSGALTGQPPIHNSYSGQGILPPPPTSSQGPSGQGGVSATLPPPPMSGQVYQPHGQASSAGHRMHQPPAMSQAPPPPGAPPAHSHVSYPAQPHPPQQLPHPPQPPKPQSNTTDPDVKPVNMMEVRNVMPQTPLTPPKIILPGGLGVFNPKPEVMCSTMNAVPTTSGLLNKMKLPLAMHIHPYKDLSIQECPVIHPTTIVRCRVCRAYINPFVMFIDSRHWRCNLCFRPNTLPEEFDYNPQTGKHGDRSQRMEIKRSSVEYIAPSEYMLRPPQPCVYLFLIDVSYTAVQSGVLAVACRCLLDCLGRLPGDARTMVGFVTYDSSLHFYNLSVGNSQPQMLIVSDVDDVFLPSPDSLLVNLKESKDLVRTLLEDLPGMFADTSITHSALGAAVTIAEKLLHNIGGRVTVIQSSLPDIGPGALKNRDVNPSATKKDTLNMAPGSDFYKKLALELSSQQIAVDLFAFSSQFIDLTTLSCVSKFSSGQVFYYHDFHHSQQTSRERFEKDFIRYLTRKIGFEAVMRVRCTEGLSLHTFHGNFFVRSTDLLSLPNTNPDHGYTINLAIDENLKDMSTVCFQAALLYTSSRGERRIRVHTLCLPVSSQPSVLYSKLNVQAIAGVLANMAVDRATSSSIGDARDALMNTVVDSTKMFRSQVASVNSPSFTLPSSLMQLPLLILSLLKNPAFTLSSRIGYDVRAQTMNLIKSHPLYYLLPTIYPSLYALHTLTEQNVVDSDSGQQVVAAPLLQLSAENTSRYGIFLMDCGLSMYIWVSSDAPPQLLSKIFGVNNFEAIPEDMSSLPVQDNESSKVVRMLIKQIRMSRQHFVSLLVIRERGPKRLLFVDRLLDGKTEDGTSYYEFLSHINRQLGK